MKTEGKQGSPNKPGQQLPRRKTWRRALERMHFPQTKGLLDNAQILFDALNSNSAPQQNPALRKHLDDNILPGLAIYQALLKMDYDREEALGLVKGLFIESMRPNRMLFEFLGRTPLIYHLTRWGVRRFMSSNFPPGGWQVEWVEVGPDRVAFKMHSCYYVDVLNRHDAPELIPVYCDLDDYIYSNVSQYMRWDRARTIGRGDEYCDFCFTRVRP